MLCRLIRTASPDLFLLFTLYHCIKNITVSESRFLTAQLGYKVTFTLVHAGKYWTEDKSKTHFKNWTQPRKANNTKHIKTKLVASYDTWPGNEVGIFYSAPEPTQGLLCMVLLVHWYTGLPVSKRPGTVVLGRWLSTRLRRPSTSTPFVWLCDLRRPTYTDHLRRPVFCRRWPTSVNSLPTELRQSNSLGQFKRQLKTRLFGLWDHSA